jgi:glyoxylase-like metal-dependent hydrolase (beta-lactamase superfamily II)
LREVETVDLAAVRWIHGSPDRMRSTDPPLQVVAVDEDTFVIRQSKGVNFEAPFLYLLLGTEMALLHDTGATADADLFPIRRTVEDLIAGRSLRIVITHSHGHGDHWAGDAQFTDLPPGSVASVGEEGVAEFFGIDDWPGGETTLDLGDRPVDVLPTPGHLGDHIVLFDRTRGFLLSGDTLLPGTLTVRDWGRVRREREAPRPFRPRDGRSRPPDPLRPRRTHRDEHERRVVRAGDDLPTGRGDASVDGRRPLRARVDARGGRGDPEVDPC